MAKSKKLSMSEFLVTFFVEDKVISRMLSDVLKNRNNPLFWEALTIPSDFTIPVSQEDNDTSVIYTFKQDFDNKYEVTLNGHPCIEHVIHSGDYFTFKSKSNNKLIKTLFIATSDMQLGYKKYKLSPNTNIFIGRTPLNDISYDFSDFISREKHAAIRIDDKGQAFIEDLKRSVGVYVNGYLVYSQQLKLFDEIFIMGLSVIFMGEFIAVRELKTESTLSPMTVFAVKMPDRKSVV